MLRGLSDFLKVRGHNIVGSASDGEKAYNLIVNLKPDIAILDIRMPFMTGLEIAAECKKNMLPTKIVLITFDKEEELYDQSRELGVYGYILKELAIEEIEICLENVIANKPYFSSEIAAYLNSKPIPETLEKPVALDSLSEQELKILSLIAHNKTAKEIGEQLFISTRTVEKHKANIIKKLDIGTHYNSLLVWAKEYEAFLE